jgi:hypothetical protein
MKVLNKDLFNARESLMVLARIDLPIKVAIRIARFARQLDAATAEMDFVKNNLVERYGQMQPFGGPEVIPPDDPRGRPASPEYGEFIARFNELMQHETEVEIDKVVLPAEIDGEPVRIAASILIPLEKFVEVE